MERSLTRLRWALLIGGMLMLGVLAGLFFRMERLSSVASTEVLYAHSLRLVEAQVALLDQNGTQRWSLSLMVDGTVLVDTEGVMEGTIKEVPVVEEDMPVSAAPIPDEELR